MCGRCYELPKAELRGVSGAARAVIFANREIGPRQRFYGPALAGASGWT